MNDLIKRLTSRKLWATVATAYLLYNAQQYNEMAAVIMAYLVSEGAGDAAARFGASKAPANPITTINSPGAASGNNPIGTADFFPDDDDGPRPVVPGTPAA